MPQKPFFKKPSAGVLAMLPAEESVTEQEKPVIKQRKPVINRANLPPARGLAPPSQELDLSTVNAELAKLFGAQMSIPSNRPSIGHGKPIVVGPTSPQLSELEGLIGEYNQIIPWVVRDINEFRAWMPGDTPTGPDFRVLGRFDPKARDIYLNQYLYEDPSEMETTLAHELAHSTGLGHYRNLYNIEGVGRMRGEAKEMWKNKQRMKGMGIR